MCVCGAWAYWCGVGVGVHVCVCVCVCAQSCTCMLCENSVRNKNPKLLRGTARVSLFVCVVCMWVSV